MVRRFEKKDGTIVYKNENEEFHRDDGPAVILSDGEEHWYKNGKRHRENGPAIIHPNGEEFWFKNGEFHREDGPAITWSNGIKEWWFEAKYYSFDDWIKVVDITDEEKMELVLYYG